MSSYIHNAEGGRGPIQLTTVGQARCKVQSLAELRVQISRAANVTAFE